MNNSVRLIKSIKSKQKANSEKIIPRIKLNSSNSKSFTDTDPSNEYIETTQRQIVDKRNSVAY